MMEIHGFDDEEIQLLQQYMGDMIPILNQQFNPKSFKLKKKDICCEADDLTKEIVFNITRHHSEITNKEKLEGALKKWVSFVQRHQQTSDNTIADATPLLTLSKYIYRAVISDDNSHYSLQAKLDFSQWQYSNLHKKEQQFIQQVNKLYDEDFSELDDILEFLNREPEWLRNPDEVRYTQRHFKNNPFMINGY